MGIRFYCPNCDRRLHVKDFLAGKKGICPHCDESIVIPKRSTAESSPQPSADVEPVETAASLRVSPDSSEVSASAIEDVPESRTGSSAPKSDASGLPSTPSHPPTSESLDLPVDDPIDTAPHLVWYVRPPEGGQYGPAEGDAMRRWLTEGRVPANAWVWQEGWDDWRLAREVFPSFSASTPAPPSASPEPRRKTRTASDKTTADVGAEAATTEQVVDPSTEKLLQYRLNRSRGRTRQWLVITALGVVCIVLFVALGMILSGWL